MSLDPQIFEAPVRTDLIHTVVVAQLAARRRGTHATKNRALVSGGGSKPYRQKGTGRARQGTTRAGQFSGGGIVFGPQPRSYAQRVPKRIRKAALRSALSLRKSEDAVHVVESLELPEIKTRLLLQKLAEMGASDALVVTPERDRTLELASRNARSIKVLPVRGLNVYDVLARRNLVIIKGALEGITERLK